MGWELWRTNEVSLEEKEARIQILMETAEREEREIIQVRLSEKISGKEK